MMEALFLYVPNYWSPSSIKLPVAATLPCGSINSFTEVQLVEVVKELDSLEMSVRLQPHLPIHRLLDDEDYSAKLRLES